MELTRLEREPMAPSGGAGTVLGVDYQARVVAWLSARALAGQAASTQMGWQPHSEIQSIWVETSDAVDDIRVSSAHDGSAFLQAKHVVNASSVESSPLAKALHQFAAQQTVGADQLVLATSSSSSSLITRDLPRVLDRIRLLDSIDAGDVCRTQTESRVFSVVTAHLRREWEGTGAQADEPDMIRRLLSRVHVAVVDVKQSEGAAIEADQLLRGILSDPERSNQAWVQLINLAQTAAILQAGLTPVSIARHLAESGLHLEPQLDFRADIDLLRVHSSQVVARLQLNRSLIGDDGTAVHIDREFARDLQTAAEESLLIIGDPGAGKSGALAELIDLLPFADIVALSADSLMGLTNGELRAEIGLHHGLADVLANWRSERPGYLVVDALDAGRGSRAQQTLLELIAAIAQMEGRWKILTTVRRFDLRYSPTLKALFPVLGSDIAEHHKLPEFSRVRHFNIGALAPGELAQLDDRAPHLSTKIRQAPTALRDLLTNLFNLRLYAELITHGDTTDYPAPITSRLQLLASYWEQRVLDSPASTYRRESLLRRVSQEMISRGALAVESATIINDASADDLADLSRIGLLVEEISGPLEGVRLLKFAHHVLFDYSVARLLLSGRDLQAEAASNPASLFLMRPSYQMYFEGLWRAHLDRLDFWTLALNLAASALVPEIAKVIAPAVAATHALHDRDFQTLLAALDGETPGAANVLQHLVSALLTDVAGQAISDDRLLLWAKFTESISRHLDIHRAVAARNMIRELTAVSMNRDGVEMSEVGLASRRLLRWTWAEDRVDRFFAQFAIPGMVSAFVTDAAGTAETVRAMIAPGHLAQYGYTEMPILAETIPTLVLNDPHLVGEIYVAAFGYDERSTDATEISRGILNMSSNRRQDYQHSYYTLAEHFSLFLEASPREAISALCYVYDRYASRYGHTNSIEEVTWAGERFSFSDDYLFFESGHHDHDDQARMLDAFSDWLVAGDITTNRQRARFNLATETLRSHVTPAGLWRSLLRSIPSAVDLEIVAPLLRSSSSLASRGLSKAIGELIHSRFADQDAAERLQIENAIVGLDDAEGRTARVRARLVGLIPEGSLQTDTARAIWRSSHEAGATNDEPPFFFEREGRESDRAENFRRNGIDPDEQSNAVIIEYAQPVKDYNDRHLNEVPTTAAVREIWASLWTLWTHLRDPAVRLVANPALMAWSFGDIARAVDVSSRTKVREALSSDDVRRLVALTAGLMSERTDEPEDLDDFDAGSVQSFELPTQVIQASIALIEQGHDDGQLEVLLKAAATDPSPSVRLAVAGQIRGLKERSPDLVATALATIEAEEKSGTVLGRLAYTLAAVEWDSPEVLVERLKELRKRAIDLGARGDGARGNCSEIAAALFIRKGTETAKALLDDLIGSTDIAPADLMGMEGEFRDAFASHGPGGDESRERAFQLAVQVVRRASSNFVAARDSSVGEHEGEGEERPQVDKWMKESAHLIEAIGNDVYFSSGAYERPGEESTQEAKPPIAEYYASARDLLLALPEIPFPSVVHHVLETLDYLSAADPAQVFRDMTDVILRGRAGGYEYDQMAASFVTSSVSRFLVQHRHLFQTEPDLRTCLIHVLDTFVAVGWGDARILTYELDTVFR